MGGKVQKISACATADPSKSKFLWAVSHREPVGVLKEWGTRPLDQRASAEPRSDRVERRH